MTTTRRTGRPICRSCNVRRIAPKHTDAGGVELCNPCYDYSSWENDHSDNDHTHNPVEGCPICADVADPANDTEMVVGHTNTVAKSHTSHAGCTHPRTPRDRATCRKARKAARPLHFCAGYDHCLPVCTPNAEDSRMV